MASSSAKASNRLTSLVRFFMDLTPLIKLNSTQGGNSFSKRSAGVGRFEKEGTGLPSPAFYRE